MRLIFLAIVTTNLILSPFKQSLVTLCSLVVLRVLHLVLPADTEGVEARDLLVEADVAGHPALPREHRPHNVAEVLCRVLEALALGTVRTSTDLLPLGFVKDELAGEASGEFFRA